MRTLYAVHPIALTDVRAIKRNTPTIGYHHIILVLHSGENTLLPARAPALEPTSTTRGLICR